MPITIPQFSRLLVPYGQLQTRLALLGHDFNLNWFSLSVAAACVFAVSRVMKLVRGIRAVNNLPGLRVAFQPTDVPGVMLPTSWWNPGYYFPWAWKFHFYKSHQNESVSVVSFISGLPVIYTSNLDVARQVVAGGHRSSFIKPENMSRALLLWGMNLFGAEGETWRKHRRIMGPAFNNQLYRLIWNETIATYREMLSSEGWNKVDVVDVPVVQTLTFKLTLLVLGKCGFGFPFTWSAPATAPDGSMSLQEALHTIANAMLWIILVPKWVWSLPFRKLRKVGTAYTQLTQFMQDQIATRKLEINDQSNLIKDAFTMLLKANEDETRKFRLDDKELIGNVFILLFGGHETTAQSLAAVLGLLALNQDVQEEILQQIVSVVGYDRDPIYDDYGKLDKVLAAFYEGLRMFPSVHLLIREATEDTVLNLPNPVGQEGSKTIPIHKGTQVIVDMVGAQYNPRYFDEPEKYKPSRWHDITNDSEAFSAFGVGPRACIGRKFATTQVLCLLTMLLRDWKIEPIYQRGETNDAWSARVLDVRLAVTLGVADVPVRFTRRIQ